VKIRFRLQYVGTLKGVKGVHKDIRVNCTSSWDLFQALVKMRGRRNLTRILACATIRSYANLRKIAWRDGRQISSTLRKYPKWGLPLPIVFEEDSLTDMERLELLAVQCWERALLLVSKGYIRPA